MSGKSINTECPFCSKAIEASVFFSQGNFLSLYNIAPVLPGHSLVIPRKHITSILDLNDELFTEFFMVARTTLKILMKAFSTEAFNWSLQEKYEAGQTIEHLHLHIVPRMTDDLERPGDWYPLVQNNDQVMIDSLERPRLKADELSTIVATLRKIADRVV